jgi:biofilm PGA synthesis N-glycosyltransferase PgaC
VSDSRRYLLITPARNEAEFAKRTLDSVAAQTVRPAKWVIVDDGSTDDTPRLLAEFAAKHDWVEIVTRRDRGVRSVGPGVIETFYAGLERCDLDDFDYVCKLDLDLELPRAYFETLIDRMERDVRLGTCSGKPYVANEGRLRAEPSGSEMSVGMTKFFRVSCFRQIGGFVRQVMWDGIDCHHCRMLGWKVRSWDEVPALRFLHLRPMGSSQVGILTGRMRHGFGQHFMGTGFAFMAASAIYRSMEHPRVVGSLAMMWGWIRARLMRTPRYEDREFRRFLRRYQWRALLRGKMRAAESIEAEMADRWDPTRAGAVELGRPRREPSRAIEAGVA